MKMLTAIPNRLASQVSDNLLLFKVIVNFALREMTAEGKAAAQLAIDRIQAGGGTNLSGGLFKGIDQHQQGANSGVQPPTQHADSGRYLPKDCQWKLTTSLLTNSTTLR